MLRRQVRYLSTTSESSEDDRIPPKRRVRMPDSNAQVRQFSENQPYTSSGRNSVTNKNKSSNVLPYVGRLRTRLPVSTSSSSDISLISENEEILQPTQRKSIRALNNNDNGPRCNEGNGARLRTRLHVSTSSSSDTSLISENEEILQPTQRKSIRALRNKSPRSNEENETNPERILNSLSLGSNVIQNNFASESSSDDSSDIQTRSLKRRTTSTLNLSSSTDSSDSGAPIGVRSSGKRTRLRSSSDSSTTTEDSENHNSEENHTNVLAGMIEEHTRPSLLRNAAGIIEEHTRPSLLRNVLQNNGRSPTTWQNSTQSRPRQRNRGLTVSAEINIRPNANRQRNNRPTTSASSQNSSVPNTEGQNNRRSTTRSQNIITLSPIRQGNRHNTANSQSNNTSNPNRQNVSRPMASRQNNTRLSANRQNNVRLTDNRARQNNRVRTTSSNWRAQPTSTMTTTSHNNIQITGRSNQTSDQDSGFSLRISIQNGQNISSVRNPFIVSRVRLDTDYSSSSSSDSMIPVVHQRRIIMTSDNNTTSDSDASSVVARSRMIPVVHQRRIIMTSDNNTTSDSDASSVVARSRRRVRLVLSDDESTEEKPKQPFASCSKVHQGISSDSDGESEKCPICFARFDLQEVGTPKSCEHCFCLECIKKWAQNNNTCPVDRQTFNSIVVRCNFQGDIVREDLVPPPNNMALTQSDDSFLGSFSDSDSESSDGILVLGGSDSDYMPDYDGPDYDGPNEICSVCFMDNDAEEMLPCDACDNVYHLQCVDPPLQDIPMAWMCPDCVEAVAVE